MKYSKINNTELNVSEICLGTMTFGKQNTEKDAHEQLNYAVENGINFIDTAELYAVPSSKEVYGLTEQYIGTWLKSSGKREELVIGTKIIGFSNGLDFIRENPSFSDQHISDAVDNSLKRLQTDYIDIYQLHWPLRKTNTFGQRAYIHTPSDSWEEDFYQVIESLAKQIEAGKIRHWAVSNETPWGLMKYIKVADENGWPRPITIQNPYNLLNRTYEYGLAEISMREDIGLLAYSPMAFGWLSGKYHNKKDDANSRMNLFSENLPRYSSELTYKAVSGYMAIAKKYGMTSAQLALAYVNSRPFVKSNIIGATTLDQLKENIDSIHIDLPKACLKDIDQLQELITNPAP